MDGGSKRKICPTDETSTVKRSKHTKLFPIPVLPFAPVRQDERQHYLKLLYEQYKKVLDESDTSAIDLSVEKEYQLCKIAKTRMEYMNCVKKLMFNLKKYGLEDGNQAAAKPKFGGSSGDIYARLTKLCISKQNLVEHGFVMDLPEVVRVEDVDDIVECEHCHNKFSRRDQYEAKGQKNTCRFHPGKMLLVSNSNLRGGGRRVGNREYSSRYHTCCHELKGQSEGCRKLSSHVFKPKEPSTLHWFKPFQTIGALRKSLDIRDNEKLQIERKKKIKAIGIDCEMCFSNRGFELTKVSAVDFRTMKPILNNLVIPDGDQVIDLNSDVSGVYSVPKEGDPGTLTFDEVMVKMAQLTDKDTIIVGHGLENDLNVLRLIYDKIVDTAVLFSENQIDPMRKDPLKKLAWKYLSKNIQLNEHDPLEDAEIPVEIVKKVLSSKKYIQLI
ncbi:hypothetical protein FOA43_001716 [Brettanomyces nanus]|uniref:RNA exonuclease 3 n=1 Tax=Eeniella nana TaxID=13502 RepID=A0A875S3L8_EENNA|nr:uncharacterized protein FOA43_001716 [Brettanomyces nanus]QPG74389.1 hypothetical protein FOA43_001716 [Brettanomyces nanus]